LNLVSGDTVILFDSDCTLNEHCLTTTRLLEFSLTVDSFLLINRESGNGSTSTRPSP
jgi:hypothetical protein